MQVQRIDSVQAKLARFWALGGNFYKRAQKVESKNVGGNPIAGLLAHEIVNKEGIRAVRASATLTGGIEESTVDSI